MSTTRSAIDARKKPYCLKRLEELRVCAPESFEFDVADLYEIAHGINLDSHVLSLLPGYNVPILLSRVTWWIEVAMAIANGREQEWRCDLPGAAFDAELTSLLAGLLVVFPKALQDTPDFAGPEQDIDQKAAICLFKRYWRFTQEIRAKARKVWPDEDLTWLWVQP